jgi:hypothetical protein
MTVAFSAMKLESSTCGALPINSRIIEGWRLCVHGWLCMIGQESVRARRRVGRDWALPSGSSIRADDSWVLTTARRDGRGTEFFCRPIATPDLLTCAVSFSLCRAALRGGGNPNCGVVGIAFAAGAEEMGDDAGTTGTDGSRLPTASAPHPYPSVTTQSLHAKM